MEHTSKEKLVIVQKIKLSSYEELQSQLVSPLNEIFYENEKAEIVQKIVKLTYDADSVDNYYLQLSYLQGQLDWIDYRLAVAEEAHRTIMDTAGRNKEDMNEDESSVSKDSSLYRQLFNDKPSSVDDTNSF